MTAIRQYLSCQDFVEQVTAYLESDLRGPLRDRFEEHYIVCPPCQSYHEQMRLTADLLARLGRDTSGDRSRPSWPVVERSEAEPHTERAFKFLDAGGVGPISRVPWPLPDGRGPGAWLGSAAQERCVSGVHACRAEDLPFWLGTELWIVELDHVVERARRKLVARKGRLIRRVEDWTPEAAAAFADGCAISLLRLATSRLQPGALPVDADTHPSVELAEDIRRRLDEGRIPPSERALLQYFCDAVAYRELPQAVGFIAELGHHSVGGPTAADAERHREAQWLIDRLGLAALHDRSHRDDR